ncbi:YlbE-like family protein [Metabacillus litoralis]|uniref:YlbE-like family protein n=1 Tax=Metabacillus TaxID=2675233 RepID=UPI000EF568A8|nr:YlbE-like family protein [Metabacillus litoralis]MCM3160372.1 YlbE-like family protein [Metabacillus litoralis]MCM3408957.1 YlbE-like family protein [Metabacillus litoralis]UHA59405.1 YlbE-like family protein [Metabacillus litoralis]
MRKEVQEYLFTNDERKKFVREQPYWYRKLSRNPNDINEMEISMMNYYQKTIPHKVQQFSNSIQMASMMVAMFQSMRQQD